MENIKAAAEAMFEAKTWESLIALINAILAEIFGFIANDQGWVVE